MFHSFKHRDRELEIQQYRYLLQIRLNKLGDKAGISFRRKVTRHSCCGHFTEEKNTKLQGKKLGSGI